MARSVQVKDFLQHRIRYDRRDLVTYSPITEKYVGEGMTIADLCAAALQYSDNTAGNLLIKVLGGPSAVTAYAGTIGNDEFRLDRWETELNSCIPGDPRDTVTPAAMALSLRSLALGGALPAADIAVISPPGRKPVVVAVYFSREKQDAKWRDDVIAMAAQIVVDRFGRGPF